MHLQKGKRRERNTGVLGTDQKKDLEHKYIPKRLFFLAGMTGLHIKGNFSSGEFVANRIIYSGFLYAVVMHFGSNI